jgi:iron complex transport system ATP-binding protein
MFTLRLENISLGYGSKIIIHNFSFEARPGEMVGLIGPNGSGKSTLIRGITRLLSPSQGKIYINGNTTETLKHADRARLIAVVPQNALLPETFTAIELVLMGRTPHLGFFRFEGEKDLCIVRKAMEATKTSHLAERKIGELSGGEKQRLLIARALTQEPKIILLDEPTAHLDINFQVEIMELVRNLCREQGLIVLIALHDLNLAVQYCDHLVILNQGRIYSHGAPEIVINAQTIKDVYGADVLVYPHPVNRLPSTLVMGTKSHDHLPDNNELPIKHSVGGEHAS